jgi:hypothetical protein
MRKRLAGKSWPLLGAMSSIPRTRTVTMIRKVSTSELRRDNALKHFEEAIESCPGGGWIHVKTETRHAAEG